MITEKAIKEAAYKNNSLFNFW